MELGELWRAKGSAVDGGAWTTGGGEGGQYLGFCCPKVVGPLVALSTLDRPE